MSCVLLVAISPLCQVSVCHRGVRCQCQFGRYRNDKTTYAYIPRNLNSQNISRKADQPVRACISTQPLSLSIEGVRGGVMGGQDGVPSGISSLCILLSGVARI